MGSTWAEALQSLEHSALGVFMRESSLWTYPVVNLLHIFGIASLFGGALIIDLRLIGVWRQVPLRSVARVATPVAAGGFALAASTGVALLATNGTEYIGNPFLPAKFGAIGVGLANLVALRRTAPWRVREDRELTHEEERHLVLFGAVSLVAWTAAVAAGRMIAYW